METDEDKATGNAGTQRRKEGRWEKGSAVSGLVQVFSCPLCGHTTHHHLVTAYSGFIHPHSFKDLLLPKTTFKSCTL